MKRIEFVVPGKAKAKQRPRFAKTKFGMKTFTPKDTLNYEQWVRTCWMEQSGERIESDVPFSVRVIFYFPIPESISKKKKAELLDAPCGKLPDLDNCIKSVLDGCQGYVFNNDSRIYRIESEKRYSNEPRAEVLFEADE